MTSILLYLTIATTTADTTEATYYAPNADLTTAAVAFVDASAGTLTIVAPVLHDRQLTDALCAAESRGVTVAAALDVTRGTSAVRDAYRLTAAGATVYACNFRQTIANNGMSYAGTHTMTGTYLWSDEAVQTGNYTQIISGTTAATKTLNTYSTLAASGTPFGSLHYSHRSSEQPPPQVWFSPNGGCEAEIESLLDSASTSISVAAYDFTSRPIADALQRAKTRGINTHILQDAKAAAERGSVSPLNVARGIDVWLDNHEKIQHSKYIIIDSETVITGSYNWTTNAEHSNAENLIVLHDPTLATAFIADWTRHAAHSTHAASPPSSIPACTNGTCTEPKPTTTRRRNR